MTTAQETPCALGVTARTLSDFRSQGLDPREMEGLQAHVEGCLACQQRLAEYEAQAQALRTQREPDNHALLWRNVQAGIVAAPSRSRRVSSGSRLRRRHAAQVWMALGSVAAVAALSVGFVAVFASHRGPSATSTATHTATVTATSTPPKVIKNGRLTWKLVTIPKGFPGLELGNDTFNAGLVIAPSDGRTGYACQADDHLVSSPTVWATHDAGVSWSVITPPHLPPGTGGCHIVADLNAASTVIVSFYPVPGFGQVAPLNQWVTYASFDGGATWRTPAGLQGGNLTEAQATAHGKVYALRGDGADVGNVAIALYVSGDQMKTWTRIKSTPSEPSGTGSSKVSRMWVDAATGEVLVQTEATTLWSTIDDGAYWVQIPYSNSVFSGDTNGPELTMGTSATSPYLTICGSFGSAESIDVQVFACTTDDGQTWSQHVAPPVAQGASLSLVSVGADGSLYAIDISSLSDQRYSLYMLRPGSRAATDWQLLGEIPDSQITVSTAYRIVQSQDGMMFWMLPSSGTSTDKAGNTTTNVQPNYYVATYP